MFKVINWLFSKLTETTDLSLYLYKSFSRVLPAPTVVVRGVPIKIVVPLHQTPVAMSIRSWNTREPETLDWIDSFEPGCLFFDIGCSFGNETLYAALRPPRKKIVAFDLDLQAGFMLAYNLAINNITWVEQYLLAVSSHSGFTQVAPHTVYTSVCNRPKYDRVPYNIWQMSLDEFADLTDQIPDYVKIDTDGAEECIVKGMSRILLDRKFKSALIEVNPKTRDSVVGSFCDVGFSFRQVSDWNEFNTCNIVFHR